MLVVFSTRTASTHNNTAKIFDGKLGSSATHGTDAFKIGIYKLEDYSCAYRWCRERIWPSICQLINKFLKSA